MASIRITKTVVEQTKPSGRDVLIHDSELKGFHVKVTPLGKRVFFVYYRTRGARVQQRRYKIGDYPSISVNRARELAKTVLGRVANGEDPSAERKSDRHRLNTGRVEEIFEQFLTRYVSKNRTASETESIFRRYVIPKIGKRSVHELTRVDLSALISDIADTAPIMANRVLAAIRKFFNWAYSKALIEQSPCVGISAPSKERQRDRLLTDDELSQVVLAAREIGYPYGAIVGLIAAGQLRASDQLIDAQQVSRPGTLTVYLEPMFDNGFEGIPPGSTCIANAYTSNYDRLDSPEVGTFESFVLHAIDTVGIVHAIVLRIQALLLPIQTLVFSGGH